MKIYQLSECNQNNSRSIKNNKRMNFSIKSSTSKQNVELNWRKDKLRIRGAFLKLLFPVVQRSLPIKSQPNITSETILKLIQKKKRAEGRVLEIYLNGLWVVKFVNLC